MTTMDLNTYKLELIRNISAADSFEDVKRAFRSVSLQATRMLRQNTTSEESVEKKEMLEDIRQSIKEMKANEAVTWEEMLNEL